MADDGPDRGRPNVFAPGGGNPNQPGLPKATPPTPTTTTTTPTTSLPTTTTTTTPTPPPGRPTTTTLQPTTPRSDPRPAPPLINPQFPGIHPRVTSPGTAAPPGTYGGPGMLTPPRTPQRTGVTTQPGSRSTNNASPRPFTITPDLQAGIDRAVHYTRSASEIQADPLDWGRIARDLGNAGSPGFSQYKTGGLPSSEAIAYVKQSNMAASPFEGPPGVTGTVTPRPLTAGPVKKLPRTL